MGYMYHTDCVNSDAVSIDDMIDSSVEITLRTFLKHISREDLYDVLPIYNKTFPIEKDYHVSYHRGKYQGKKCYYVVHSAIEYVFIKI